MFSHFDEFEIDVQGWKKKHQTKSPNLVSMDKSHLKITGKTKHDTVEHFLTLGSCPIGLLDNRFDNTACT